MIVAGPPLAPSAPAVDRGAPRPDVVLIVTDDQRAGTLSLMPGFRRRVERRGVSFGSAFVSNPSCCPSRATILTGTYSHTNGVWKNHGPFGGVDAFDPTSTLATWLDDAGYRTGLFGKYLNAYVDAGSVPPGWDEWFAFLSGEARTYYGFAASVGGQRVEFDETHYSTTVTAERVEDFIRSTPAGQPLFALWTPTAPHGPSVPEHRYEATEVDLSPWRPPGFNERDVADKPRWVRRKERLTAAERRSLERRRRDVYRTLFSVDDGIVRIVRALRDEGRLGETILLFTSDNGLMWGEHRLQRKAVPYAGASQVPLVIRYDPLTAPGRASSSPALVGNVDIAPTIADLVGIAPSSPVEGRSIADLVADPSTRLRRRSLLEHAEGGAPAYCGARTGHELFVRYTTGEEEYYELRSDPWELDNLAGEGGVGRRIAELRDWVRARCRPFPPGFTWRPVD
jgi:arylsulfatase A-like enzyme